MSPSSDRRTRLAPSPTGSLHLGNARTFLLTWALARNEGWQVRLRLEDLDAERVRPDAITDARASIAWLGLEHDGEELLQSRDLAPYENAMRRLAERRAIYRCERTRADVRRAASAPHAEDGETRFLPALRPESEAFGFAERSANHRLLVEPGPEAVRDELHGERIFDPGLEVGDFLVWTRGGAPAYQLAVVVDDHRQGVTDVVRGDDLLASAARQQLLHRLLGQPVPRWWHLPLVAGPDGRRLAKRREDLHLAFLRSRGVRPERVIGLLAFRSGLADKRAPMSLADFRPLVRPDTLRSLVRRESTDGSCRLAEDDLPWLLS
jgi:glutamyl-tRNA synthetase